MSRQDKPPHANLAQLPRDDSICELPILLKNAVNRVGDRVGTTAAIPTAGRFKNQPRYFDLSRFRIWVASLPCEELASTAMTASAALMASAVCLP